MLQDSIFSKIFIWGTKKRHEGYRLVAFVILVDSWKGYPLPYA